MVVYIIKTIFTIHKCFFFIYIFNHNMYLIAFKYNIWLFLESVIKLACFKKKLVVLCYVAMFVL